MTLYKRITAVLLITLISLLTLGTLWNGLFRFAPTQTNPKQPFYANLEEITRQCFPLADTFRSFAIRLKLAGGESQQEGVFIGEDILLENVEPPNADCVDKNIDSMLDFVQDSAVPVYAMIIPEKCAIKQQQIPSAEYVQLFNQRDFIEQVGEAFSGQISMVDAYSALFPNQEQYIYYRTDPSLTALGAYYVYDTLASRLNVRPLDISRFTIQHIDHDFYGSTYKKFPYSEVPPDVISLYHLRNEEMDFSVRHNGEFGSPVYPTLYPERQDTSESPLSIYLGGNSGDMEIRANKGGVSNRSLLIFGDDAILPVLPFLAVSFDEIRFIDLSKLDEAEIFAVDVFYYDQVVFAYSLDTFAHTDTPSRIAFS